jgi:primosomal protein N' (replication factor Y)
MAAVTGTATAEDDLLNATVLPGGAEVIGPAPSTGDSQRMLIRVPRSRGAELATALKQAASGRSARKAAEPVKVVLDPLELF